MDSAGHLVDFLEAVMEAREAGKEKGCPSPNPVMCFSGPSLIPPQPGPPIVRSLKPKCFGLCYRT